MVLGMLALALALAHALARNGDLGSVLQNCQDPTGRRSNLALVLVLIHGDDFLSTCTTPH